MCEDDLCEKCIIKQLLNSVFALYHELSKPRVCVITDLGFDNSWYHAQPHPIIVYYLLIYYRTVGAFKTFTYRIGRELVKKRYPPPLNNKMQDND